MRKARAEGTRRRATGKLHNRQITKANTEAATDNRPPCDWTITQWTDSRTAANATDVISGCRHPAMTPSACCRGISTSSACPYARRKSACCDSHKWLTAPSAGPYTVTGASATSLTCCSSCLRRPMYSVISRSPNGARMPKGVSESRGSFSNDCSTGTPGESGCSTCHHHRRCYGAQTRSYGQAHPNNTPDHR